MPRHWLRSLTRLDLEDIRRIVREELAEVRSADDRARVDDGVRDPDVDLDVDMWLEEVRRADAERKARPIPNTPFVDRYDAARLLGVRMDVILRYLDRGLLTRRKVKGKLSISRAEIDALLADPAKFRRRPRSS